ncbi:MAG TPA: tyrosine-type recombinase/integrase [Candidatus Binataceae bacterium]|nr:tyrosine-type recombinase/integrase [Candidatus Binataceae bacterium]
MNGPRKRIEFPTKKAAEKFLAETAHKASRGEYIDPGKVPLFTVVAEQWFRSKVDFRPSHVVDLRGRLDKHLIPAFGSRRLDEIRVIDIEKLRDDLRDNGHARTTVNRAVQIVNAIFKLAIRQGRCAINPTERVDRIKQTAAEIRLDDDGDDPTPDDILNPDEIRRLLDAAIPGFDRRLFMMAFVSGARQGELFALQWTDIELPKDGSAAGRMHIRRTLSWSHPKGESPRPRFYPPKTKAGLRSIEIPPGLVAALKRWKLQCPASPIGLVFPRSDGQPMYREFMLRRRFYPALNRARLRRVRFHSLRHSCASAMIAAGASITEVQHHLGHASPAMTLGTYSHWFRNAEGSGAVQRLSRMVAEGNWAETGHLNESDSAEEAVSA